MGIVYTLSSASGCRSEGGRAGNDQAIGAVEQSVEIIRSPVKFSASLGHSQEGSLLVVNSTFEIPPPWHIYPRETGQLGLPTKITISSPPGLSQIIQEWPQPTRFVELSGDSALGYQGQLTVLSKLSKVPPAGRALEGAQAAVRGGEGDSAVSPNTQGGVIKVRAEWLACSKVCIPEEAEIELRVR